MNSHLFSPLPLGPLSLPHRIVMAPMTRCRTTQPGNVPNALMARYYAQRASAGLIITEATQISPQGQGYSFTPGIHTDAQTQGWQLVTEAVHAAGGRVFLQLWHVGRMSHPVFHDGAPPVAPSALAPDALVWVADEAGTGRMVDCPVPRALVTDEVEAIVADYRAAAARARQAGFDGVEIHGANGYLIDQFLRTTSNHRDDRYGGSRDHRVRLLFDVVEAVAQEVGVDRVGLRLSPFITARGMACPDIVPTVLHAARALSGMGLAYLHLSEADGADVPTVPEDFRHALREVFTGRIIVAGGYDVPRAEALLDRGLVDLVAFGRPFIANPDLPERLRHAWPLAPFDGARLFGGTDAGYTTYPPLAKMKAVAYQQALPIDAPQALQDVELPVPVLGPRDLLVQVQAIAVNPVDTKVRSGVSPEAGQWKVLGWDAVGIVREVGPQVSLFKPGDRVWYAGAINRPGVNAELHAVDERIVALAPASLGNAAAAAMPLTAITAWEMLFDRLGVARGEASRGQSLLVIGAAGGVGSMMVQLARQLTELTVIGTASRPESAQWVRDLGAHHVIDHSHPLAEEWRRQGLAAPTFVVSLTQTGQHFRQIADLIAPQGRFGLIDDPVAGSIDIAALKRKSVSLHWELMFTRSLFDTPDLIEQHRLLTEVARLVDAGRLHTTLGEHFGAITAENLRRAHALLESGKAVGKVVLEGF